MSTQYRQKPVVIEAVKYAGVVNGVAMWEGVTPWLIAATKKNPSETGAIHVGANSIQIRTLEGMMFAGVGDYIIKGVKGELYPCKPDIFAATYEEVAVPASGDKESKTLRRILSECIASLQSGSQISEDASIEFMRMAPKEVELRVTNLLTENGRLRRMSERAYASGYERGYQIGQAAHG